MKLKQIKSIILAALAILLAAIPANAQHRQLPAAHNAQHDALIANQRPMINELNAVFSKKTADAVTRRENLDEIYENNWDSESVNPYAKADIPMMKDINVAEGVVPHKGILTSPYGWRARFGRMHRGVDIGLRVGDTIRAAFSGKVRLTKFEGKGYGYYVVLRHDNGMETVYGHLSKFLVKPNQTVKAGDPIALGGNTGRSTGPHLHFETRYMGLAINPEAIFDFTYNTTIKDIFTFDKSKYDRTQVSSSRRAGKAVASAKTTSSKAKSSSSSKRRNKRR